MQLRLLSVVLLLLLACTLDAAKFKGRSSYYENKGAFYAEGESFRLVASREQAELAALKDAIDRLAALFEKKGYGTKKDIALNFENAVMRETDLSAYKLGRARVETVYQERWEAPDGKEAWSVKIKISIRRR